jgi:hypothetical protein
VGLRLLDLASHTRSHPVSAPAQIVIGSALVMVALVMFIKRASLLDAYERFCFSFSRKNPKSARSWAAFNVWFGIIFLGAVGPPVLVAGLLRIL